LRCGVSQLPYLVGTQNPNCVRDEVIRRELVVGGDVVLDVDHDLWVTLANTHPVADTAAISNRVAIREVVMPTHHHVIGVLDLGRRNGMRDRHGNVRNRANDDPGHHQHRGCGASLHPTGLLARPHEYPKIFAAIILELISL